MNIEAASRRVKWVPSQDEFSWANWFALLGGIVGAVVGLTVILGWHMHLPGVVQLRPQWAPMQYNTAFCFFLASCALISAVLGQSRAPMFAGALVAAVGLLTGLQYGLPLNLGIDQLLFDADITVQTSSPGRMAPNTAICFVLLGWAIFLMGYRVRRGEPSSTAIMLASLTVGLALVALTGYVTGLESAYGWGQFTSMAVHTASVFLALGIGVSAFHWPRASLLGLDVSRLTGVLITLTTLGVLLIVILAAAIGLIPYYEQIRHSLSGEVSQRLQGEVAGIQHLLTQTTGLADSLGENDLRVPQSSAEVALSRATRDRLNPVFDRVANWQGTGRAYLGRLRASGAQVLDRSQIGELRMVSASPVVAEAIARGVRGERGVTVSDTDENLLAFFSPVAGTDWVAVSAVPAAQLYADADQRLVLIGMLVMLVALCGAFGMARLLQPLTSGILVHSELLQQQVSQATRELEASVAKLEAKNSELQEFSYVVSHDLQAPLRGIGGFAALLERNHSAALDAQALEYLSFIRDGVQQMSGFIQGFLQLSRLGSSGQPMARVDMNALVAAIGEQLRYALREADAQVRVDDLPDVRGDEAQIRQLFQNLIDNAIKFRSPERCLEIRVTGEARDQRLHLAVQDNGLGVEAKDHEAVFRMFSRASATKNLPGSGIGLALCRRIVAHHGGEIAVRNLPDGGACFTFSLPLA